MAFLHCPDGFLLPPLEEDKPFHGCDGLPWSDDFLRYHIDKAVDEEDYEWAAKCKKELDRRGLKGAITKLKK